jgi:putative flippase GtrA
VKVVRYFFVGGAAATVDFVLFALLNRAMGVPWFWAGVTGFAVATLVNYVLSVRHVFTSGVRFSRGGEITLVFTVSAIGLAVNQTVLWLLIEGTGWNSLIAKVVATASVFFWNFGLRHSYIFRESS